MEITTKSGFKLNLDKEVLDDWRITEAIADTGSEDDTSLQLKGIVTLTRMIFRDQKKAYYTHVSESNGGRVPNSVINEDITDIFEQLKEAKNS